jgi:hypothetical protein
LCLAPHHALNQGMHFRYDEMDKLRPCQVCGSRRYWFDGEVWQCWSCVPLPSADMIRVDLNERVN